MTPDELEVAWSEWERTRSLEVRNDLLVHYTRSLVRPIALRMAKGIAHTNDIGQDFISFGSIECEDLICVRDAAFPRARNEDGTINGGAEAKGYCSKACVEGSNACDVKDTSGVQEDLPGRMTCRALLLDQETLEALRAADENTYRQTFGENNSPFFCAGAPPAQQGN